MMRLAAQASSLPTLFGQLEDAGMMLRIDRSVTPTMAKAPTLGRGSWSCCAASSRSSGWVTYGWRSAAGWTWTRASVTLADDALVVNCAADGLK